MRRIWPRNTQPAAIPPDAEEISMDEWRRRQTHDDLVDPVRARDLAKRGER